MIFVILNILFGVFLIWFTMKVDVKTDDGRIRSLINITLFTSFVCLLDAFTVMIGLFDNEKITSVMGMLMLLVSALLSVNYFLYCILYPKFKTNFFTLLLQIIFIGVGVYILFFQFDSFAVTKNDGFVIKGKSLNFALPVEFLSNLTWMDVYYVVFIGLLPLISVLALVIKMITGANVVYKQQTLFTLFSVLIVWGSLALFYWVSTSFEAFCMYDTLFTAGLVLIINDTKDSKFPNSFSSSNETLPIITATLP